MFKLDYNNALLYKINQKYLNKLQRIQNVCAGLVMKSRACDSSEDLRKALHWLPIEQRIVFKINLLTYKCLNNEAPKYLQNLPTHEQLSKSTRSEGTRRLQERLVRKRSGDRAFRNAAPSLWNDLSLDIHLSSTVNQFKHKLKSRLWEIAFH